MTVDKLADWISIVAGSMTILGLGGIVSWGIGKHFSNAIANRIYHISLSVLKLGLSSFMMFIIFFLWKFTYQELLLFTKGSLSFDTIYWDEAHLISHIVCYAITVPIFFFLFVMCVLCVVMGSLSPFTSIPEKWRNKNIALDNGKKKAIEISKAEYGSGTTFVDVKEHLNLYIFSNRVEFKLTNKIFGFDPTPGVRKVLKLVVKSQKKEKQFEFEEGSSVKISEDDIKP